jgi:hypothetical protein
MLENNTHYSNSEIGFRQSEFPNRSSSVAKAALLVEFMANSFTSTGRISQCSSHIYYGTFASQMGHEYLLELLSLCPSQQSSYECYCRICDYILGLKVIYTFG